MGGNFKVKCVDTAGFNFYTKGKVYSVVNGAFTYDDGETDNASYQTFEDFANDRQGKFELVKEEAETKGNFKVICVKSNQRWFTTGKIYEIKDGKITDDDGEKYPLSNFLENIEQLKVYASSSEWKLLPSNKSITRIQKITVKQKGRKVIAILSEDGKFIKAAKARYNPNDAAEGKPFDFEIGKKLALNRLLGLDTILVINPNEPALPKKSICIDKQAKYEIKETEAADKPDGNFKARCTATKDCGLEVGKVYEFVNGFSHWKNGQAMPQYDRGGISRFSNFKDLIDWFGVGNSTKWEEVKEETPLTASTSKVGKNGVEIGDTIKVLASDYTANKYVAGGTYKVLDIESDKCPRVAEGTVYGVVTEAFEITRKASNKPEVVTPLTTDGFKVGDKVRLKKDRKGINTHGISQETVSKYEGKTFEIEDIEKATDGTVYAEFKGDGFSWNVELLELASKAHPLDWTSFKSGKFAVHCGTEAEAREFLKECDGVGIKWNSGEKASESNLGATCYIHRPEFKGLTYSGSISDVPIINYTSSKPTVKEVSRMAKVGEWVKVTCDLWNDACKKGDIKQIKKHYHSNVYGIEGIDKKDVGDGLWTITSDEYVVLEGYVPEDKPEVKEVNRPAKVGEWVKILRVDGFTEEDHKVGDIFQAIECTHGRSTNSAYYANRKDGCGYVDLEDYVVLENYVPDVKPEVKEVKRKAEVGEWIKVVDAWSAKDLYKNGDIMKVRDRHTATAITTEELKDTIGICDKEYVVLENYQPDNTPVDSKPEPEQPISFTSMKEVKREAKTGEYVKVVNAQRVPRTDGVPEYANGDILKIIKSENGMSQYGEGHSGNGLARNLYNSEYVVLENFDYSIFPKNEPFKKAKVGDKIKVVRKLDHHEAAKIGHIHTVNQIDGVGVWADEDGIYFWDENQEYIIIEEAPQVNRVHRQAISGEWIEILPTKEDGRVNIGDIYRVKMAGSIGIIVEDKNGKEVAGLWNREYDVLENYKPETPEPIKPDSIEIGDTVKIIDSGETSDTYREFIEKNAKDFASKFEPHYVPKNGDVGVVVGQGKHPMMNGNYFVVLSNGKAFCIAEKGIEKVRN